MSSEMAICSRGVSCQFSCHRLTVSACSPLFSLRPCLLSPSTRPDERPDLTRDWSSGGKRAKQRVPPRQQNPRRNLNPFLRTTAQLSFFSSTRQLSRLTTPKHPQATPAAIKPLSKQADAPPILSLLPAVSSTTSLPPLAAVSPAPILRFHQRVSSLSRTRLLDSHVAQQFGSAERSPRRLGSKRCRAQGVRRYSSRWIPRHRSLGCFFTPDHSDFFYSRSLGLFTAWSLGQSDCLPPSFGFCSRRTLCCIDLK